ncbi:MAG TPA: septal ring lytic transglycosylase RlpA family lipoprotein [Cytophagales bacterium]|nr:septal ring lytic transglycosylase RlpA family lipoprotein [Cytophagales bacterium]
MIKRLFILGICLTLAAAVHAQTQTGKASYYADKFEGRQTASGEKYRHSKMTAAHKFLPFGTKIKVTNLANNKEVEVVVNDRGPYVDDRIVDLSKSAAEQLDFLNQGLTEVRVEVIDAGDGRTGSVVNPIDNVAVDEKEFYDFEIERLQPSGFGVQIGTYQELVNLMRLADNLKKSYQKKVVVQVKVINGVKYYSLIIGAAPSRTKAEPLLRDVRKKFPDAFLVEYNKMK